MFLICMSHGLNLLGYPYQCIFYPICLFNYMSVFMSVSLCMCFFHMYLYLYSLFCLSHLYIYITISCPTAFPSLFISRESIFLHIYSCLCVCLSVYVSICIAHLPIYLAHSVTFHLSTRSIYFAAWTLIYVLHLSPFVLVLADVYTCMYVCMTFCMYSSLYVCIFCVYECRWMRVCMYG